MLQTVAAVAVNASSQLRQSTSNELVEIERGVHILVSGEPMKDGHGQGEAFTWKHQVLWLMSELHKLREENSSFQQQQADLQNQVETSQSELSEMKKEHESNLKSLEETQRKLAEAEKQVRERDLQLDSLRDSMDKMKDAQEHNIASEQSEYCGLLVGWLQTHNMRLQMKALPVFHGTKSRAQVLWNRIVKKHSSMRNFINQVGKAHNLIFVDNDEEKDSLVWLTTKAPEPNGAIEQNTEKNETPSLSASQTPGEPSPENEALDGILVWLKRERNGIAHFNQVVDAFPSAPYSTAEELVRGSGGLLTDIIGENGDENKRRIVVKSMIELVFLNLLCTYIRTNGGSMPASRFATFKETVPGALQLSEQLPGLGVSSLAKKYPDRIHFFRDEDTTTCCLSEERGRLEQERIEKRRKENEAKSEERNKKHEPELGSTDQVSKSRWASHLPSEAAAFGAAHIHQPQQPYSDQHSNGQFSQPMHHTSSQYEYYHQPPPYHPQYHAGNNNPSGVYGYGYGFESYPGYFAPHVAQQHHDHQQRPEYRHNNNNNPENYRYSHRGSG